MNQKLMPNGMNLFYIDQLTADYIYREIYEEQNYFQHGISLKDGDTIFDVGANIGLFSKYVTMHATNLNIYTFEPVPSIFEVLTANLANQPGKVKNYNFGLAEKASQMQMIFYPKVSGDSAIIPVDYDYKIPKYLENYNEAIAKQMPIAKLVPKWLRKRVVKAGLKKLYKGEMVTIELRTLSEIIQENGIQRIDLLKIDAENYESQVLAGINAQDWPKIQQIAMEVHTHIKGGQNLLVDFIKLLENKGFKVFQGKDDLEARMGVFLLYAKRG